MLSKGLLESIGEFLLLAYALSPWDRAAQLSWPQTASLIGLKWFKADSTLELQCHLKSHANATTVLDGAKPREHIFIL